MSKAQAAILLLAGACLPLPLFSQQRPAGQAPPKSTADVRAIHAATGTATPEVAGAWRGRIETLIVDSGQSGVARTRFFLRTGGETLELVPPAGVPLRTGQTVEVVGSAGGAQPGGRKLTASKLAVVAEDASPACSSTGEQSVAIILASFPSKALLSTVTPALLSQSFFGAGHTVDAFLREASYGQTWITGDVFGPVVMDGDYFDQPLAVRDAAVRAAAGAADLTKYNRIVVVAPQGQTGMESGGMALLGCGPVSSPQGELTASSIWLGAESMIAPAEIADIGAHEMGHALGLQHARFADYGSDVLGPAGQAPAPWDALHEYGDSNSNMGRNSAQWAAPQKSLLGWLTADGIETVTAAGNFTLVPYESQSGTRALRVSRDAAASAWIWLEYRQPQGTFDTTLLEGAFDGLLGHYEDPALTPTVAGSDAAMYSNLVNFHPEVAATADPFLHAGQSWADSYGGLRLSVSSASGGGVNVSVSYAAAPVCPASLGAPQSFTADAGAGQVSVAGAEGCQWNATASASWIQLGANHAGAGSGTLQFTLSANPDIAPRWGKITAGDAFLIVRQAGATGWVSASPLANSFSSAGGTGEISVATTAPDLVWGFTSDVDWITDVESSTYQTIGPATLRYIVAANAGAERLGHINVGGQKFTVTQNAGQPRAAAVTWNELAPTDAPSARLNQAVAATAVPGQMLLYGGQFNLDISAETWLWDGTDWRLQQPAHNPGPVAAHAMAFDKAHGQIVLFGGTDGVTFAARDQTWVWDGTDWRQMNPLASPPARFGHAMVYDEAAQKVVLFGGWTGMGLSNDTWLWDGANWTQATPATSPDPRSGHAMAFDAARGVTVLFGGITGGAIPSWLSDTWTWDGSAWHQEMVIAPPAARSGQTLAYDPALGDVVMVGGSGGKQVSDTNWYYDFRRETWLWNGLEWIQQFPEVQPGPAYTLGAVYDGTKKSLTLQLGDDLTCASRGPKTFQLSGPATSAHVR